MWEREDRVDMIDYLRDKLTDNHINAGSYQLCRDRLYNEANAEFSGDEEEPVDNASWVIHETIAPATMVDDETKDEEIAVPSSFDPFEHFNKWFEKFISNSEIAAELDVSPSGTCVSSSVAISPNVESALRTDAISGVPELNEVPNPRKCPNSCCTVMIIGEMKYDNELLNNTELLQRAYAISPSLFDTVVELVGVYCI